MTVPPTPYQILRAIQDQQAVMIASQRATERLVTMLAGMLDMSGPEPLLAAGPMLPQMDAAEAAEWMPRAKARSNRAMRRIVVGGTPVIVSELRAKMVEALIERPRTTEEIVELKLSTSADAVRKAFVALNFDFTRLGIPLRIKPVERLSRVGPKGGSILPRYALVDPEANEAEIASAAPSVSGSAECEAPVARTQESGHVDRSASARPYSAEGGPAIPSKPGDAGTGQGVCDDQPSGAEAGSAVGIGALDPAPAADDPPPLCGIVGGLDKVLDLWRDTRMLPGEIARQVGISRPTVQKLLTAARDGNDPRAASGDAARTPIPKSDAAAGVAPASPPAAPTPPRAVPPESNPVPKPAPVAPPSARTSAVPIEPGDLLAVEVKLKRIQTKAGSYEVGGANLARALDMMKGGHMFGLDVIAKRAGWPSAEVARTALGFERNRLAQHGIDLFIDKFNARLRVPA